MASEQVQFALQFEVAATGTNRSGFIRGCNRTKFLIHPLQSHLEQNRSHHNPPKPRSPTDAKRPPNPHKHPYAEGARGTRPSPAGGLGGTPKAVKHTVSQDTADAEDELKCESRTSRRSHLVNPNIRTPVLIARTRVLINNGTGVLMLLYRLYDRASNAARSN